MMQLGLSSYTYTWAIGVPGLMPEKPMEVYDLIDKAFSTRPFAESDFVGIEPGTPIAHV